MKKRENLNIVYNCLILKLQLTISFDEAIGINEWI